MERRKKESSEGGIEENSIVGRTDHEPSKELDDYFIRNVRKKRLKIQLLVSSSKRKRLLDRTKLNYTFDVNQVINN